MRLKKLVSLLSAMTLTLVMAAGCAEKKASFTEYAESDAFRFYAYMTPPPANTGTGELANNPDFMTDEQYQWVAECGFNYAIPIYEGTFENNLKAMDMLGKYGVQYFPQDQSLVSLASQLNDPTKTEAEIEASKAQAAAVKSLRESNIGIIGHVFRGMYDIELSKTFLKGTFGVNLIQIQSSHLMDIWQNVSDAEAEDRAQKLLRRFARKNVTEQDVFHAMKLAIAMQRLSKKFHLDALCFLDQHFIQRQVKASARMGASLLMENTGMSVNCEGDIGGLVTMMLMRAIAKDAPLMAEWGEYDAAENACLLIGHGIGTPDLAKSDGDVMLTRTPEEWGFEGAGLNYELAMKPGPATIAHVMEGPEGYRMLITRARTLDLPRLAFDELHAWARVETPVKEYLERIFDFGVSHHCIIGEGDMAEELEYAAKLLKLKTFRID